MSFLKKWAKNFGLILALCAILAVPVTAIYVAVKLLSIVIHSKIIITIITCVIISAVASFIFTGLVSVDDDKKKDPAEEILGQAGLNGLGGLMGSMGGMAMPPMSNSTSDKTPQ